MKIRVDQDTVVYILTLLVLIDSSIGFIDIKLGMGWSIAYIKESPVIISELNCILSLKMDFILENSVDLD